MKSSTKQHASLCMAVLACLLTMVARTELDGLPDTINGGKPVTLIVDQLYTEHNATQPNELADAAATRDFMRHYPNVTLKPFELTTSNPIRDPEAVMRALSDGHGPDILNTSLRESEPYARFGFTRPLDREVTAWIAKAGAASVEESLGGAALSQAMQRFGEDGQRHYYFVPTERLVAMLMYRKDILRAAKIDLTHLPETWDDFYRFSIQVADPSHDVWAYSSEASWFFSWAIWSMDPHIMQPTDPHQAHWTVNFASPEAVKAFQFAWKLRKGSWAMCPTCGARFALPSGTEPRQLTCPTGHRVTIALLQQNKLVYHGVGSDDINKFGQGRIACMLSYMREVNFNNANIDPTEMAIARVPAAPNGRRSSEINAKLLAISGAVTDPAKLEAAWIFLRYQCSDQAKRVRVQSFVDQGRAGDVNPALLKRFGYGALVKQVPPDWEAIYQGAMRDGYLEPYGPGAYWLYNALDKAWYDIAALPSPDSQQIHAILARETKQFTAMTSRPKPPSLLVVIMVVIGMLLLAALLIILIGRYIMKRRHRLQSTAHV